MAAQYTEEEKKKIVDQLCKDIENGKALRNCLKKEGMPTAETFYRWIDNDPDKAKQYARAMELRAEAMFEEIRDIAESDSDQYYDEGGNKRVDGPSVQKKRLQIDVIKWQLGKMQPKKYGDKIDITTNGESMNMSSEERDQRIKELIAKAQK